MNRPIVLGCYVMTLPAAKSPLGRAHQQLADATTAPHRPKPRALTRWRTGQDAKPQQIESSRRPPRGSVTARAALRSGHGELQCSASSHANDTITRETNIPHAERELFNTLPQRPAAAAAAQHNPARTWIELEASGTSCQPHHASADSLRKSPSGELSAGQ